MSESRGPILAALAIAAAVAMAIMFPPGEDRSGPIVTELPARGAERAGASFSAIQRNDIRNTVREYLLDNPEVIVEALELLQARQEATQRQQNQGAIAAHADQLVSSRRDPFIGNPDASVTVVEFFDYQCPYCKRVAEDLAVLAAEDSDVRIVFKEFPVFGTESSLAARAALAAAKQGKYAEFHLALMRLRGAPSETAIFHIAGRLGMNAGRLRRDMGAPEIEDQIQANLQLARQIGVRGTPAFIVGDRLIPGALSPDQMRALIAEERGS
ncbi:MAG: DsbA family protein [Rhodospirillaceae bacterium]